MNLWDHPNDYPSHALPPPTRERSRRVLGCAVEDRRDHLVQTLRDRRRGLVRVLDALQIFDGVQTAERVETGVWVSKVEGISTIFAHGEQEGAEGLDHAHRLVVVLHHHEQHLQRVGAQRALATNPYRSSPLFLAHKSS